MSRLLQVIIALAGLAVSIMLGVASDRAQRAESRQAMLGFYTNLANDAAASCNPAYAAMAENMLTSLAESTPDEEKAAFAAYIDYQIERLGTIQSGSCGPGSTVLAQAPGDAGGGLAQAPVDQAPAPSASAPQMEHATANIELRQAEIIQSRAGEFMQNRAQRAEAEEAQRYFAVLASYNVDDPETYNSGDGVVADYQSLLQRTQGVDGFSLKVLRTSASNHFAIVLEPNGATREGARDLVAAARANGWSADAFVQAGTSWVECAEPTRIARGGYDCLTEAQRSAQPQIQVRRPPLRLPSRN